MYKAMQTLNFFKCSIPLGKSLSLEPEGNQKRQAVQLQMALVWNGVSQSPGRREIWLGNAWTSQQEEVAE